jgi:hypothetical protein
MFAKIDCSDEKQVKAFVKFFDKFCAMKGVKNGYLPYVREVHYKLEKAGHSEEGSMVVPASNDGEAKAFFKRHRSQILGPKWRHSRINSLWAAPMFCYVSNRKQAKAVHADIQTEW